MRSVFTAIVMLACAGRVHAASPNPDKAARHARIDALIGRMALAEKIGQLTILGADNPDLENLIRSGQLGGTNGVLSAGTDVGAHTRRMQNLAMQSRLKIPLWFMGDTAHGFRTVFPVPLALAASWNLGLVERVHRAAAIEATSEGVDWTFSPMVDISRDPRWGRVVEGGGVHHAGRPAGHLQPSPANRRAAR